MQNIRPARSLERRSRNWLLIAVVVGVLGLIAGVVGLFLHGIPLIVPSNPNYGLYSLTRDALIGLGVLLFLVAVGMAVRAVTWRQENELALAIGDALADMDIVDQRYTYIRNINKFAIGYVDSVLVGPPGVLVFRITQKGGTYFNEGAYWMQQKDKGEWKTLRWSPTKEAVQDIKKLREFLAARNLLDVPVFGVVVFTEDAPATRVTTQDPVVPVVQPSELSYELSDGYFAQERIDQLTVNKIARLLRE